MRLKVGIRVLIVAALMMCAMLAGFVLTKRDSPADTGSMPTDDSAHKATSKTNGEAVRWTTETGEATQAVQKLFPRVDNVHEAWLEPECNGVLVFFLPSDESLDVQWLWYDAVQKKITERISFPKVSSILTSKLDNFRGYERNSHISMIRLSSARSSYVVGESGNPVHYNVRLTYTGEHCGAVPDTVEVYDFVTGQRTTTDIDLRAELGDASARS